MQRLRKEDLKWLDELSDVRALMCEEGDAGELDWDMLVRLADHRTTHAPFARNRAAWKVVGFGPPKVAAPAPGAVAAQPRKVVTVDTGCHTMDGGCFAVRSPCKLCQRAGRASSAHTHVQADCFINPKGAKFRRQVAMRRIAELK